MRITLNLATRPFTDIGPIVKRLRIGMLVLVLVSGAFALGLHAIHSKASAARAHAHSLDGAIATATAERQGYVHMMQEPDNAHLLAETQALNKLFDEKAFSWTLTMESLETVLPSGVQVSTLEPIREKDGHIVLRMRVLGPRDKGIEFVRNLEHSHRFLLPRIVNESAQTSSAPGQSVQPVSDTNRFSFDLLADYNPPTSEEIKAASKAPKSKGAKSSAPHRRASRTSAAHDYHQAPPARALPRRPYQRPVPKPDPDHFANPGGRR